MHMHSLHSDVGLPFLASIIVIHKIYSLLSSALRPFTLGDKGEIAANKTQFSSQFELLAWEDLGFIIPRKIYKAVSWIKEDQY